MRDKGLLGVAAAAVIAIGGCQVGGDRIERGEDEGADAGVPVDPPDTPGDGGDAGMDSDAGIGDADAGMAGGDAGMADAGTGLPPLIEFSAFAEVMRASCDDRSATYAAYVLDGNGDPMSGIACAWAFSDGETSDQCHGTHVFTQAGLVGGTVLMAHPLYGLVVEVVATPTQLHDPVAIDLEVSAPGCGLTIDYAVSVSGGSVGKLVRTVVEPVADVLGQDITLLEQTVEVAAPGTYTVRTDVEDETTTFLCTYQAVEEITVVACEDPVDPVDPDDCPKDGKTR
jgi:hypothetical protein